MNLKILLPYKIFKEVGDVKRMVVDTSAGSYGLLPNRLDFAAALVPGILSYEAGTEGVKYIAVDEGVVIKTGAQVLVSVRNAVGGTDLGKLHEAIDKDLFDTDKAAKEFHSVMGKMESGLMQSLERLREE